MPTTKDLPDTVCFVGCPAWHKRRKVTITGLFDVVELLPYEPSNYVHEDTVVLVPHGREDASVDVSWADFQEQVFPDAHARLLVEERWHEFYSDDSVTLG